MGKFGKLAMLGSAREAAKRNADKVHGGVDKVASAVKSKLGAGQAGKVDKCASLAKKALTGSDFLGEEGSDPTSESSSPSGG